jgi:hypothetical protein
MSSILGPLLLFLCGLQLFFWGHHFFWKWIYATTTPTEAFTQQKEQWFTDAYETIHARHTEEQITTLLDSVATHTQSTGLALVCLDASGHFRRSFLQQLRNQHQGEGDTLLFTDTIGPVYYPPRSFTSIVVSHDQLRLDCCQPWLHRQGYLYVLIPESPVANRIIHTDDDDVFQVQQTSSCESVVELFTHLPTHRSATFIRPRDSMDEPELLATLSRHGFTLQERHAWFLVFCQG